jgi:hypothetical protein
MRKELFVFSIVLLSGCVQTAVQPLTQSSFKIATEAEDLCGAKGTREIAFKSAAIEVIKRGADRFIVVGDQSRSTVDGGFFTGYGGFDTYGTNMQDMVVQIVSKGDPNYGNALSARQTLGPNWQEIVAKGSPDTCL